MKTRETGNEQEEKIKSEQTVEQTQDSFNSACQESTGSTCRVNQCFEIQRPLLTCQDDSGPTLEDVNVNNADGIVARMAATNGVQVVATSQVGTYNYSIRIYYDLH